MPISNGLRRPQCLGTQRVDATDAAQQIAEDYGLPEDIEEMIVTASRLHSTISAIPPGITPAEPEAMGEAVRTAAEAVNGACEDAKKKAWAAGAIGFVGAALSASYPASLPAAGRATCAGAVAAAETICLTI